MMSMNDTLELFYNLAELIRWGEVSPSHQTKFEETIQKHASLVQETDEFGTTLLMIAADAGNLSSTKLLCELHSDVNAISPSGETPLINAVRGTEQLGRETESRLSIIACLLSNGANPNLLGYSGCSAFHWAIIYGYVEFVEKMFQSGAKPELRTSDPLDLRTAYELAISGRFRGTAEQRKYIVELLGAYAI